MLTADVEAQLRAGTINQEHARRLREAMSITINAIVDHGPELLDVLVPVKDLRDRALSAKQNGSVWVERLRQLAAADPINDSQMERKRLFSQFTAVLRSICQIYPLILILDDLQWIDKTSASLLYHLSRHLAGQRLLIVCAYRREEAALGRDGKRHPMDKVLSEVKRVHRPIWINLADLDQAEEQQFVNSLLDQEPHKLTDGFRQALFNHTGGHSLFTVELLRAMQERGDLVYDDAGYWVEGPTFEPGAPVTAQYRQC